LSGHLAQIGQLDDYTTEQDEYATVAEIPTLVTSHKQFGFEAIDNDLMILIGGSKGDGRFSMIPDLPEFLVSAGDSPIYKTIPGTFAAICIMAKPAVSMQNGTLSVGLLLES